MVNQQLIDYVKTEEQQGYTAEQLRNALLQQGCNVQEVDEAIALANMESGSSVIKRRNPFLIVVFSIFTFGIYSLYWFVATTNELRNRTRSAPNPLLLMLVLIPFLNIIIMFIYLWKYSKAVNEMTGFSPLALFLLLVFMSPIGMIIAQIQLNSQSQ